MRTWCGTAVALLLPLLLIAAWPLPARAVGASTSIAAVRAATPLPLDAALTDPRWNGAPHITDFTEVNTRTSGHDPTAAALFYDDTNLYVAFWCRQLSPVTAKQLTDNVGFGTDDYVGVGIDPSGNADRAYYFEITPAGTRFQQATESARYQPQWQGSAKTSEQGWNAVLIIPLSAMRLPNAPVQSWRINFVRNVAQGAQKFSWSFSGQMDTGSGFPDLLDARYWATLSDIHVKQTAFHGHPSAAIYALGTAGSGRDQFVTPEGTQFDQAPHNAGFDLTYPLTSTMAFVGALNPDFSNVEADQQTITPQVFQRNLTEYRPFFAQGANFINNAATSLSINEPPNLTFYSPSIGPFERGFKVEGTYGRYQSLGVLEARGDDPTTGLTFDDLAFGWKHVLPSRTFAYWTNGAIANHGDLHDAVAEFGMEARDLRTGWVGAIFHEREQGTLVSDPMLGLSTYGFIDHQGANHEALVAYKDIGPLYYPVDGFTQISDIRGPAASYGLFGSGRPGSGIKDANVYVFADRFFDRTGAVHKADMGFSGGADFTNQFTVSLGTTQSEVRSYNGNNITGYPFYSNPLDQRFDTTFIGLSYKQNSPTPINTQYSWGAFGAYYLQQITSNMTRPIGKRFSVSVEYDGTRERYFTGSLTDGQWLRRFSFGWSIDSETNLSFGLRDISGNGGFAVPGMNVSGSFHRLFSSGNELYIDFGTPAANQTIDRWLFKYVFHVGAPSAY